MSAVLDFERDAADAPEAVGNCHRPCVAVKHQVTSSVVFYSWQSMTCLSPAAAPVDGRVGDSGGRSTILAR